MWWNTAIILIWLCIFFTIVAVTIVCQKKKTGIAKPISIIFAGMLLAVYIGIFPGNYVSANYSDNDFIRFTETFFISIADLIQVFTANNNVKELLETIRSHESFFLQQAYIFTMSIMCTVAPLLTIGTLISILMRLSAGRRYLFSFFKTVYIFSDLNDRSIVLASDIKNNHPNSMIVFTDVVDHEDETSLELSNRAKSIGAILFKQDILTPKFHMHRKKAEMLFFIMGDNEAENIEHSLILTERYKNRENTRLYIFSSTRESELALTGVDKGKLKVRRINEVQSLIYRTLYEKGEKLFDKAIENNGTKNINVVVLGMGNYGTEMVKALAWFCQMDGYKLTIHAFDKDPYAESKFKALCPDLMSDKYNGKTKPGETDYTIIIHSSVDVDTSESSDIMKTIPPATFVFISLGSDEENVKTAANMRALSIRCGFPSSIQSVVRNSEISNILSSATNHKGQTYDIDYIGDLQLAYSEHIIINSELETIARNRHVRSGYDEDLFWRYEYYYRSSVASEVQKQARNYCHVRGTDKLNEHDKDKLTAEEIDFLRCLEHCRWNAFTRGEGYICGIETDHLAKTHKCLVSYYDLPPEIQALDDIW